MSSRKHNKEKLQQELRREEEIQKQAKREAALWGMPIIGIAYILFMWQIDIFHKTVIPESISLLIMFVCSLIAMPFFKKWFAKRLLATNNFHVFFYCVFTSGCLFSTAFMTTNYYFADSDKISETLTVINTGYRHQYKKKCDIPYIEIEHKERSKELDFSCGTPIKSYKYIDITFKTGFWGFDVIVDKRLHN